LSLAGKTQADAAVAGDVIANFNNSSATGYGLRVGGGASGAGYALSVNNYSGTELLQVTGAGNVGIGTASPSYKLDVTGQGRATTGFAVSTDGSTFTPAGLNAIPNYGVGYITSTSQTVLSGFGGIPFYTNQAERMRITQNGGVSFGSSGTAYGSSGQVLVSNGDTAPTWGSAIVSGTAQATTSGTTKDFTSIPSWVKRITVMFNGVSTSGTSNIQIQIGSGSVSTSGYNSRATWYTQNASSTAGFISTASIAASTNVQYGTYVLTLISGNAWTGFGNLTNQGNDITVSSAGASPALGGALDRVRITTVNGTDTFDAGSVNILYE
jgi:hypothetical protein